MTTTATNTRKPIQLFLLTIAAIMLLMFMSAGSAAAQTVPNDRIGESLNIRLGTDVLFLEMDSAQSNAQFEFVFGQTGVEVHRETRRVGNPVQAQVPGNDFPPEGWVCPPEINFCVPNVIIPRPDENGNIPGDWPPDGWTCPPEITVCIPTVIVPPSHGGENAPPVNPFPPEGWTCPPELNVCIPTVIQNPNNGGQEGPVDPNPFPPDGWECPEELNFCVPGSLTIEPCDPNEEICNASWHAVFDRPLLWTTLDGRIIEADSVEAIPVEDTQPRTQYAFLKFEAGFECEMVDADSDVCRPAIKIADGCTDTADCHLLEDARHGETVHVELLADSLLLDIETREPGVAFEVVLFENGSETHRETRQPGDPVQAQLPGGNWPPEGWTCPPEINFCIPTIIVPRPDENGDIPGDFPPEGWTCPPELTVCIPTVIVPPTNGNAGPVNPFPPEGWTCPPELNVCIPTIILNPDNGEPGAPDNPGFPPDGWVCPPEINFCVPGSIVAPTCTVPGESTPCRGTWNMVFDSRLVWETSDGGSVRADSVMVQRIQRSRATTAQSMEVVEFSTDFVCEQADANSDICRPVITLTDSCDDADNCDLMAPTTPTAVTNRNMSIIGTDNLLPLLFMALSLATAPMVKRQH